MKNNNSDGIRKIPMPIGSAKDIDPKQISTGSLAVDNKRVAKWTMMIVWDQLIVENILLVVSLIPIH